MKKNKIGIIALTLATMFGCSTTNVNAATAYVDEFPENVTRNAMISNYRIMQPGFNDTEGKTNAVIEFLSNDSNYLLYCSDRNNPNIGTSVTLGRGNIMDYRIAYILTNGYNKKNLIDGIGDSLAAGSGSGETAQPGRGNDMANLWITQIAIWNIQNTFNESELNNTALRYTLSDLGYYELKKGEALLSSTELWRSVASLVSEANNAQDPAKSTLVFKGNNKFTKSDNILKSNIITIVPSSSLATIESYSLSLENAPEGTKVYTEDGADITNSLSNIEGSKKIYITVDNSKLDESKEYNFKLNATAKTTYDAAYQYVDKGSACVSDASACAQPSVLVGPVPGSISDNLDFQILPNTASNISQIIYYVGFIILLIGAGTIYANARPKREEE